MLNFTRGIHSTRCLWNRGTPKVDGPGTVQNFLKYWKTPRDLRLLMYRPRHSPELLARDLIDPDTDRRARPQPYAYIPSKYDLRDYMNTIQNRESLQQLQDDIVLISKRSDAITPFVLNELLIKFAEFERLQNSIIFLYSSKEAKTIRDSSNLNMVLTMLYLNPHKSLANKFGRIQVARKTFGTKHQNSITDLLEASIIINKQGEIKQELLNKIQNAKLDLPLARFEKSMAHQLSIPNDYEHLYLTLKPISLELGQHPIFKDIESVKQVETFVSKYEALLEKLNKDNRFEKVKANSKFFTLKNKSDQTEVETSETSETEQK